MTNDDAGRAFYRAPAPPLGRCRSPLRPGFSPFPLGLLRFLLGNIVILVVIPLPIGDVALAIFIIEESVR